MDLTDTRLVAYREARETLNPSGGYVSPDEIIAYADKLTDWLLNGQAETASDEVKVDDTLPSLKPDDGFSSLNASERLRSEKSLIGTENRPENWAAA